MAEQAILSVSLKDYKKKIDELRGSLLGLEKDSEDYKKIAEQLKDRQDKLNEVMSEGKEVTDAVDGSYNALSATMSKLKKEWKNMEIGTREWEAMGKQINDINDKLKDADAKVGVFSRNVGDYANAFEEAINKSLDGIGRMGGGIADTAKTLKNLVPIIKKTNSTAIKGLSGVKKAIVSTGIGALVVAVGLLIANWDKLMKFFRKTDDIDALKEANDNLNETFKEQNRLLENEVTIMQAQGATVTEVNNKKIELIETQKQETQATINATKAKLAELEAHSWFRRVITGENGDIKDLKEALAELESTMKSLNNEEDKAITNNIAEEEKAKLESEKAKQDAIRKTYEEEKKRLDEILNRVKDNNKSELQALEEKYKEEKALMQKYGKDTSGLDAQFKNDKSILFGNSLINEFNTQISAIKSNPFSSNSEKGNLIQGLYFQVIGDIMKIEGDSPEIENLKKDFQIQMLAEVHQIATDTMKYVMQESWADKQYIDTKAMKKQYDKSIDILNRLIGLSPLFDEEEKEIYLQQVEEKGKEFGKEYKAVLEYVYQGNKKLFDETAQASDLHSYFDSMPHTIFSYITTWGSDLKKAVSDLEVDLDSAIFQKERLDTMINTLSSLGYADDAEALRNSEPYLSALRNVVDAEKALLEQRVQNWKSAGNLIENASTGMLNIWSSYLDIQEAQMKQEGKTDKKIFEQTKQSKIALARVNSIEGALAAFMGYQELPQPYGAIVGAIQAAAVLAAGQAQIEQIKATKFDGDGNVLSSSATQNVNVTPRLTDYAPEGITNLTGASDTDNLANAITKSPIKAYVVESEVTAAQSVANQRNAESSF